MMVEQEIAEALKDIDDKIAELQVVRQFVKDFRVEKMSHEQWQRICDSPLRSTRCPEEVAKLVFPIGQNFKTNPNSVSFEWNNFLIKLPTSRQYKTDLSWVKYVSVPCWNEVDYEAGRLERLADYIKAVESHEPFFKRASLRYQYLSPCAMTIKYATRGLWAEKETVKACKKQIEDHKRSRDAGYQKYLTDKENYEKLWFGFFDTILPLFQEWYGEKDAEQIFNFTNNAKQVYETYKKEKERD